LLGTRHDRCSRMEDEGNYMTNIDWLSGIGLSGLPGTLCSHRPFEKLCFDCVMDQVPGRVKVQKESGLQWDQGHQRGQQWRESGWCCYCSMLKRLQHKWCSHETQGHPLIWAHVRLSIGGWKGGSVRQGGWRYVKGS
jgi:hypothetical protein